MTRYSFFHTLRQTKWVSSGASLRRKGLRHCEPITCYELCQRGLNFQIVLKPLRRMSLCCVQYLFLFMSFL